MIIVLIVIKQTQPAIAHRAVDRIIQNVWIKDFCKQIWPTGVVVNVLKSKWPIKNRIECKLLLPRDQFCWKHVQRDNKWGMAMVPTRFPENQFFGFSHPNNGQLFVEFSQYSNFKNWSDFLNFPRFRKCARLHDLSWHFGRQIII